MLQTTPGYLPIQTGADGVARIRGTRIPLETIIAVVAPAGTPAPVVERLDRAIRAALARPEVKARFAATTTEVVPLTTGELEKLLATDLPRWHTLIKAAGIEPQ